MCSYTKEIKNAIELFDDGKIYIWNSQVLLSDKDKSYTLDKKLEQLIIIEIMRTTKKRISEKKKQKEKEEIKQELGLFDKKDNADWSYNSDDNI